MATARLGKDVVDLEDVTLTVGAGDDRAPAARRHLAARAGGADRRRRGQRLGQDDAAAAAPRRARSPTAGRVKRGQDGAGGDAHAGGPRARRGSPTCACRRRSRRSAARSGSATATSPPGSCSSGSASPASGSGRRSRELSGGERRRLQLLRLLMGEPNVLVLDEPTNDLDTDTLAAVEDALDGWPGTLLVVSHDRYLLERVIDRQVALLGDGRLRDLPGGVEQYLALRRGRRRGGGRLAPRPPRSAPAAGRAVRRGRCGRPARSWPGSSASSPGWPPRRGSTPRWRSRPPTTRPCSRSTEAARRARRARAASRRSG